MADSDLRFKSMWGVYQTAGNHSNGASASCYVIIHSPLVVKLGVKLNADYWWIKKKWTLSEHSSSQRCGAPDFFWRHRPLLGRIGRVLHTPSPHQTETWENKKTRIGECGNKTAKCDLNVHGGAFNSLNVTLMPLCDQIGSIFVGILVILSYFVCCLVVSCVCCDEWAETLWALKGWPHQQL